jgi:RNA polymerase sigma-70 factor, ECF subfamily
MTGDRLTSEDIVQNVFLQLYRNMNSIKNTDSINYWIFRTARNEVYMYYRRKRIMVDRFDTEDSNELEIISDYDLNNILDHKEIKKIIENELNKLSPEQSEVFILKEYSGLSYSEISAITGSDEKLVKSRLYKTRQKLIKKLQSAINN